MVKYYSRMEKVYVIVVKKILYMETEVPKHSFYHQAMHSQVLTLSCLWEFLYCETKYLDV